MKRLKQDYKTNEKCAGSIGWFIEQLFKREYCRYYCLVHGDKVFDEYGIHKSSVNKWGTNLDVVERWREGKTGMPFVDASMRELNATGFIANRGRKVAASYLTLDVK